MNRLGLTLLAGAAVLGFSTATMAADLIVEPPAPVVPLYTWDGGFIGVLAGGAWGGITDDDNNIFFDGTVATDNFDVSGWVFGLDAGYNWTTGNGIVLGIVGDVGWADLNGNSDFNFDEAVDLTPTLDATLNWAGSVRGRVGWDGGAWMPYLTAGVAFANVSANWDNGVVSFEDDQTYTGWTAGLGVEFAATQDLSVDLLWRWTDYGSSNFDLGGEFADNVSLTSNLFTAGLHWRF